MHLSWMHHIIDWMRIIQEAGPLGWCLFIGLYVLCCLLFLPGSLLTIAAGAVYGFWGGSVLVLVGNGLGSAVCLLLTRFLLRDWMARRFANHPQFRVLENVVAHNHWQLILLTRLSPIMPFSLINYTLGLTDISPWRFLLATEVGSAPATFVYVYIGTLMGNLARVAPELKQHWSIEWDFQSIGLILTIGVTIYIMRLTTHALKQSLHC